KLLLHLTDTGRRRLGGERARCVTARVRGLPVPGPQRSFGRRASRAINGTRPRSCPGSWC
ncbi:hypothetical protein, partial [Streptomyces sp. NPDC001759]